MKTFEDEIVKLNEWYFAERDKITAMNIPREGGLDGGDVLYVRELQREYHERLNALEEKYNINREEYHAKWQALKEQYNIQRKQNKEQTSAQEPPK